MSTAGAYRHIVAFRFKPEATEAAINGIVQDFVALATDFEGVTTFEHGVNVSPEGLDRGCTHVFVVTFRDRAAFEAYLPHPQHVAFVDKLKPILDEPFVVDYEVS